MGFINLTGLTPGKTYDIAVRAKSPDGVVSANSVVYTFTAPSTNIDGTQLVATNNSVVSKIVSSTNFTASAYTPGTSVQGGALTAGPLDDSTLAIVGGINLLDYWNGDPAYIAYYISGSPDHGAVIINETGILGTKLNAYGSTPKFLLSTDTGDAYFAGTLSAPDGMIGGFHIGSTSLSNTVGDNTISINSGDAGYPSFQIYGASSSIVISGDQYNPSIKMDNVNANTEYSDLLIQAGVIVSPDFNTPSTYNSRGEILFWGANSLNPNQITIRRYGESGSDGPDGLAFIDLTSNTASASPDEAKITMVAGQSDGIQPNDSERASIELYKTFGDTSTASYPAYLNLKVYEGGSYNSLSMSNNKTSIFISADGRSNSVDFTNTETQFNNPLKVSSYDNSSDYAVDITGSGAQGLMILSSQLYSSLPILTIKSNTSTGNALEFRNLYGTVKSYFDADGKFFGVSSSAVASTSALYAPNLTASTSNTQIANTAFVSNAILGAYNSASSYTQSSAWNNTSASVGYASSAGYLPVSGLSASTITIGSTAIGLGNTSTSLSGITSLAIATSGTSTSAFTVSESLSNNSLTGGTISIATTATATTAQTPTGGEIRLTTSAGGSGAGLATGGNITIQTSATGTGAAGNITITSGAVGTINNFNIGATTPGTGNFTNLTSNSMIVNGNLSVSGSAFVSGSIFAVSASNLEIADSIIYLSASNYYSDLLDIGFYGAYGTTGHNTASNHYHAGLVRNHLNGQWNLFSAGVEPSTGSINFSTATYDRINVGGISVRSSSGTQVTTIDSDGSITAASFVGNGAGLTGITASATGSVTIGSTVIGLGGTSASLGGLTNLSISTSGTSTSALTISESLSNNNLTGGTISIATSANATTSTSPTGGAISITTTAGGSGGGLAGGGNITIQTSATGTGTAGAIAITSGITGSIENMSIGATTPRAANFSSIGLVTPGTGYFTSGFFTSLTISDSATITLGTTPVTPGLIIKNQYLNQTANLLEFRSYMSSTALVYFDNDANLISNRTASFSNKVTAASFAGDGSALTSITASNVSGTVGSAASVGSTVIGGILNSSSNTFTLLSTPATITAFSAASSITIGYQANGTSLMNIGPSLGYTGTRTLNLFTTLGNSGGQNTINIGSSGATLGSTPQVINIGTATGAYNTITIGGATDTILNLNATASVTGKITAASFVGNGAGLTNIPTSALSASTITIGSTSTALGGTSTSLSGISSISASSASISGTINAASVIATQVTGGGMDLIYSGTVTSTSGSVLIDNIFSSSYANYRVLFTTTSNGSNTSIYFKYANAGVPSSSALYSYSMLSNATATQTSNSGSVIYHSIGAYATGATHAFEFYGPALTTTHMYKMEVYDSYSGGPFQQTVRGSYTNSSSFSGIVLATLSSAATFNGTVRVYGYHN